MQQKLIDTHVHVWNFDKAEYAWLKGDTSILNRSYHLVELEKERLEAGITGGILVQAANNFEDTDWMLDVAKNAEWIKGVVGWLPLMHPKETERALKEKYSNESYFKGVRHLIHDEPNTEWLLQDEVIESLKIIAALNLPYDVVGILPAHIETALKLAEKIPSLKMVFDHLNQPPISTKEKFGKWGQLMCEASKHKNFYVKISGLGTTSKKTNWQEDDIQPYIEFTIENFGIDRCICGGDWPVSLLAGSYADTWSKYKKVIGKILNEHQQAKIFYENAVAFYNL